MKKLTNKVAVITGGSSGIGLATAQEFVDHGSKVVIFGRNKEALDNAITQLGKNSLAVQGDVTNLSDIERLFNETKSKFGHLDILIVNAAQAKLAKIADTSEE